MESERVKKVLVDNARKLWRMTESPTTRATNCRELYHDIKKFMANSIMDNVVFLQRRRAIWETKDFHDHPLEFKIYYADIRFSISSGSKVNQHKQWIAMAWHRWKLLPEAQMNAYKEEVAAHPEYFMEPRDEVAYKRLCRSGVFDILDNSGLVHVHQERTRLRKEMTQPPQVKISGHAKRAAPRGGPSTSRHNQEEHEAGGLCVVGVNVASGNSNDQKTTRRSHSHNFIYKNLAELRLWEENL